MVLEEVQVLSLLFATNDDAFSPYLVLLPDTKFLWLYIEIHIHDINVIPHTCSECFRDSVKN